MFVVYKAGWRFASRRTSTVAAADDKNLGHIVGRRDQLCSDLDDL